MRARGAVERDPKDEPRSGEDKGRVTRGLGVMGWVGKETAWREEAERRNGEHGGTRLLPKA